MAGEAGTEIDFLAIKAKAAAVGDHDSLVVKWVMGIGNAVIGPDGGGIDPGRTLHVQGFMGQFQIELLDKGVSVS